MRKADFPKVVKVGQTRATIYRTPSHGCDSFTVVWYEGAVRKRKAFADITSAEIHANAKVESMAKGEAEILHLSGEDRLSYIRSREAVAEFGLALDTAAFEYRDAKRLLRGGSLLEAARYYMAQRLHDIPKRTVEQVFDEMLKAKRAEGLSERYVDDLDSRVGKFANDFDRQIASISGPQIKEWLQGLNVANRTRNNFRIALQTLFSFAKAQKYLPKDWNEFESVPVWKVKNEAVEIFAPEEMATLLAAADDRMIPFLTIGAFAGLRSAEIERLDWAKVNLTTGYITVDASIAKTNSRRLVPISDNLKEWLASHAKKHGPVIPLANVPNAINRLVDATRPAGVDAEGKPHAPAVHWKHNALRHSFCSYRLAEVKNAAQVALEAGNSPRMIFEHYRELVTEDEAKEWFGIGPKAPANVRAMPRVDLQKALKRTG